MTLDQIQVTLKELLTKTNRSNYQEGIDLLDNMVIKYAGLGGDKKKLEQFLLEEYDNVDGEEYKEELIGEILSRLSDYCSPCLRYSFSPRSA